MNAIETYKCHKKLDKIWDFFEKEHKEFINFAALDKLCLQIVVEAVVDFSFLKNVDYRYYPWHKKIREKKKELCG